MRVYVITGVPPLAHRGGSRVLNVVTSMEAVKQEIESYNEYGYDCLDYDMFDIEV